MYAKDLCRWYLEQGVQHISVRVDTTGGYGNGIIEGLGIDLNLTRELRASRATLETLEVSFGMQSSDPTKYANAVTEMYFQAAEALRSYTVVKPPTHLEVDLTDRQYDYRNWHGRSVFALEEKKKFKSRVKRSPDDGDGAVLALAPLWMFDSMADERRGQVGMLR